MPAFPLLTQPGDLLIGGIAGIESRLPGNATTTRKFLLSVGDGENPSAPSWDQVGLNDVSGLNDALAGKAAAVHTHSISDVTNLSSSLALKADLVDGVIPTSQIPAIAITEFLGAVDSEEDMLELVGQRGDYCYRNDLQSALWLTDDDPTEPENWLQVAIPSVSVQSVNGQTGFVVLGYSDVGAAAATHSHAISDITNLQTTLDGKLDAVTSPGTAEASKALVLNANKDFTGVRRGVVERLFVNANPSDNYTVLINGDITTTAAGAQVGIHNAINVRPAADSASQFRAYTMALQLDTDYNLTDIVSAAHIEVRPKKVGTVNDIRAIQVFGLIAGSSSEALGNVSSVSGIVVQPVSSFSNGLTATVTNAYGIRLVNSGLNLLTLTNHAGIAIPNMTVGTNNTNLLLGTTNVPTGNYSIYSSSTYPSYINGNVGIGTNAPAAKLHSTVSTIVGIAPSAVADGSIGNGQVNIWIDESANKLMFKCKTSTGTIKTGEVALT